MSRIEDEVCKKIQARAAVGKEKYGVTMETAPLSKLEWMVHLSEELMDATVYLQKLIEMEQSPRRDVCWWCGGKLIWQSDFDNEYGKGMVTYMTCTNCKAEVQYTTGDE